MHVRAALTVVGVLLSSTAIAAAAQCGPQVEKQIVETRIWWVWNWNHGQLDDVVKLYAPNADLLSANGSRASGQDAIRASLEKQIGSTLEVRSLAITCSDAFAYDTGTYTETGSGQRTEGSYLVVLFWKNSRWPIMQHAWKLKPAPTQE
jgi:hypothetical protein